MAHIINGNELAATIRQEVKTDVEAYVAEFGKAPGLNLLLVGDNPASEVYVRFKAKDCEQVGIISTIERLPVSASEAEVIAIVEAWNSSTDVHGILVQLPLPSHINEQRVLRTINPAKDVDGFHPENAGRLMIGLPGFVPCTPAGVVEMLHRSGINPSGKHVVVVGRSNIVGKPLTMLLGQKRKTGNATVTMCHTGTPDISVFTRTADIVVAAVGVAGVITAEHIRPGAIVIDVGINRVVLPDGSNKLVGDVDYDSVAEIASAITPVPGGVGPMTRAMLLVNTMHAAKGSFDQ